MESFYFCSWTHVYEYRTLQPDIVDSTRSTYQQHVQYARHQQLNDLRRVDDSTTDASAPHSLRYCHVAIANPLPFTCRRTLLVQAVHQDLSRVASSIGYD